MIICNIYYTFHQKLAKEIVKNANYKKYASKFRFFGRILKSTLV